MTKNAQWRYISQPALLALCGLLVLTLFFELWRLILLLSLDSPTRYAPAQAIALAFAVGLRFDISIASYLVAPVYLLGILPGLDIARSRTTRLLVSGLLILVGAVAFFLHLVDIEFFRFFNARLNGMALQWADSPDFVLNMLWQSYPVIGYLLLWLVLTAAYAVAILALVRWITNRRTPSPLVTNMVYLPLMVVLLVAGARGRIEEKAPLTWGMAYFSQYDLPNQLALNPSFTFLRDVAYDAGSKQATQDMMERIKIPEADSVVRDILGLPSSSDNTHPARIHRSIRVDSPSENAPNVILVIMESFSSSRIGVLDNRLQYDLSPCFDSLAEQGVLFTNIYASGCHTYTGILSTLYGYPTIYGKSIMKQIGGQNRFPGLPTILRDLGYETLFFTTHDPLFDNMQGFLMANGIMRVISVFDYDPRQKLSTLGVPDHVMFDHAVKELQTLQGQPFFAALLTSSNHGPWLVPDVPFGRISEDAPDQKQLNAFKYSDWALGHFIEALRADSTLSNTLIVITADHGLLFDPKTDVELTQYQIPLLILHTDSMSQRASRTIDRLGSQIDIVATTMGLVGLNYEDYTFGRDLLAKEMPGVPFAQFSEWDKIGYVEDGYYHITRIDGPESLYRINDSARQIADQVNLVDSLPETADRMRQRALSIYQAAYFNMWRIPMSCEPEPSS